MVPFVVLYCVVFSFRFHFDFGIFWSKKTYYEIYINTAVAILTILTNYYFIKTLGLFGSVYAKCVTTTVHTMLIYYIANKLYKIEYKFKRVLKAFALAVFIYTISTFIDTGYWGTDVCIKLAVSLSYPFILYLLSLITREEAVHIKRV